MKTDQFNVIVTERQATGSGLVVDGTGTTFTYKSNQG